MNNNNGQAYGYTLYETTITSGGSLKSGDSVRDRALVSLQQPWRSAGNLFYITRLFNQPLRESRALVPHSTLAGTNWNGWVDSSVVRRALVNGI